MQHTLWCNSNGLLCQILNKLLGIGSFNSQQKSWICAKLPSSQGDGTCIGLCKNEAELIQIIDGLEGQLTGTLIAEKDDDLNLVEIVDSLQNRVGRIIYNGVPTGVEVCPSMQHGGPYPASTDSRFTAVGTHSIKRWVRPISYQSFPMELLPDHLKK